MSRYEILLFAHVLAAAIWVGSAVLQEVLAERTRAAGDALRMATFAGEAEAVGTRLIMPVSIVLLLTGIGLVLEGPWGFTELWIVLGLAGYAASAVMGAALLGPESARVRPLIQAKGLEDPEVSRRLDRLKLIARLDIAVLVLVVFVMTVKPG